MLLLVNQAFMQQEQSSPPPDLVAIVDIEARRNGCCQEMASIWSPLTGHCNLIPADQAMRLRKLVDMPA